MAISLLYYYTLGALILLTGTTLAVRREFELSVEELDIDADIPEDPSVVCTPYSDEYYRRVEDLVCDRDYNKAILNGIKESKCQNEYYTEVIYDDLPCEPVTDERTHVEKCSEFCSLRQFYYFYCTYLGQKRFDIDRECGVPDRGASYCGFDKGDFCVLKSDLRRPVLDACLDSESLKTEEVCSATCKNALEIFKEKSGCCVSDLLYYDYDEDYSYSRGSGSGSGSKDYDSGPGSGSGSGSGSEDHGSVPGSGSGSGSGSEDHHIDDEKLLYYIFSACDVDIPEPCTNYLPPIEFLDCTRDNDGVETTTEPPTSATYRPVTTRPPTDTAVHLYSATIIVAISLVVSVLAS